MNLANFFKYGNLEYISIPKTEAFWDYRGELSTYQERIQVPLYSKLLSSEDRLGLEIEIEEVVMKDSRKELPPGWFSHQDGSLRNGIEFISTPLPLNVAKDALCSLFLFLEKELATKPSFSWRTSIHVHSNVRHFEFEHLGNLILLYLVFEQVLFSFGGGNRKNSVFCVPVGATNMQYLTDLVINFRSDMSRDTLAMLLEESHDKYAALNLKRLWDYGSVEFRHLPGVWDVSMIVSWMDMIQAMSAAARKMSRAELQGQILNLNTLSTYSQFMLQIFGPHLRQLLSVPSNVNTMLSEGVTAAKEHLKSPPNIRQKLIKGSGMQKYLEKYAAKVQKIQSSAKKETPQSKKGEGNLSEVSFEDAILGFPLAQPQVWHVPILNHHPVFMDSPVDPGVSESEDSSNEEEES